MLRGADSPALHYINDPNGCPIRLIDSAGHIQWAARHQAWGGIAQLQVKQVDNPLRLQGQYEDGETGLHYNRHRYYAPQIGAFISQDPLGLAAGVNVHDFAPNALGWMDPLGLSGKCGGDKAAKEASLLLNGPIIITKVGMAHVVERHTVNNIKKFANKSKFNVGENLSVLIKSGTQQRMVRQTNGNFARAWDVGRPIGIDRLTGQPTSMMTVITRLNCELVTAFPGRP